uniref:Uncharacterized protein n=1 Tax=Vitis vinifera TaxID=29760 RepID=A5C606_VITVI|nr:hypothetical protein VITISV_017864 [Vitis vinifera]
MARRQKVWDSNPLGSNLFGEVHCSTFDLHCGALTPLTRVDQAIYRGKIVDFLDIYPEKSSGRYFCKKNRVDTLRHTIFSSLVETWLREGTRVTRGISVKPAPHLPPNC